MAAVWQILRHQAILKSGMPFLAVYDRFGGVQTGSATAYQETRNLSSQLLCHAPAHTTTAADLLR